MISLLANMVYSTPIVETSTAVALVSEVDWPNRIFDAWLGARGNRELRFLNRRTQIASLC